MAPLSPRQWIRYLRSFVTRKVGQDILWNVASLGFLAIGGLSINFIIVAVRDEAALGVFNQIYAIYIVLSQFGVGGIQHSVLKQISHNQTDRLLCSEATTAALALVSLISIPVSGLGYVIAKPAAAILQSPAVGVGLRLAIPGLFFFGLNKVLINTLNGLRYMQAYAVFRSLRFIFIPVSVLVLSLASLDVAYLALAFTVSEALLFLCLAVYTYSRVIPLRLAADFRRWFAEHLSFGTRGFMSGVLLELNTRVDILMLGALSTDATVGIYSFAAMLAEGLSQLPLAVRWNVDPVIGEYFASGDHDAISRLAQRTRRAMHPAMLALALAAAAAYPFVVRWLAPDILSIQSWVVFDIILIGVVFNAGFRPFGGILLQSGRAGTYTLFILGLVINDALLNLIFIPTLGIYGAAIVTTITYSLEAIGLVIFSRRLFDIRL